MVRAEGTNVIATGNVAVRLDDTVFIGGVEVAITEFSGSNRGIWLADLSGLDTMRISSLLTNSTQYFYGKTFQHLMIKTPQFTDAEGLSYSRGLEVKHEL